MAVNRFTAPLLLSIALIMVTASCKKKDDSDKPVCRITSINTVDNNANSILSITYNNDGKFSTITNTSAASPVTRTVFTYGSNAITVTNTTGANNEVTGTIEIQTDSRQHMVSAIFKNALGKVQSTATIEYDASGHLTKINNQDGGGTPTVSTAVFTGDDLTSLNSTSLTTYTYYTDKAVQDGDYFKILQLTQFGALYVDNAHLLKSQQDGNSAPDNFNYDFDADGKITKLTMTSGATVFTIAYTYLCQ